MNRPTLMQRSLILPAIIVALAIFSHVSSAQLHFGIEPYCMKSNALPQKSVKASLLYDALQEYEQGANGELICLQPGAKNSGSGFEADFDDDGSTELFLLYHSGPDEAGCNALILAAEESGTRYTFKDGFKVMPGKARMRPMKNLDKGIQMYVEGDYSLPDGAKESKGSIFAVVRGTLMPLISWVQKDGQRDGKRVVTRAQVGFADLNFDDKNEMYVTYRVYEPGAGSISKKNMVERYTLVLDFVAEHMRYVIYDSIGYDKVKEAAALTSQGRRKLYSEKTRDQGIIDLTNAIEIDPMQNDARLILGRHLLNTGKYGDAENILKEGIAIEPTRADLYEALGNVYIKLNVLDKALANFRRYLELNPRSKIRKSIERKIKQITVY